MIRPEWPTDYTNYVIFWWNLHPRQNLVLNCCSLFLKWTYFHFLRIYSIITSIFHSLNVQKKHLYIRKTKQINDHCLVLIIQSQFIFIYIFMHSIPFILVSLMTESKRSTWPMEIKLNYSSSFKKSTVHPNPIKRITVSGIRKNGFIVFLWHNFSFHQVHIYCLKQIRWSNMEWHFLLKQPLLLLSFGKWKVFSGTLEIVNNLLNRVSTRK